MRITFFGGSITYGSGASEEDRTSYRALVSDALAQRYPNQVVESVNAAVGGTGSDYGRFRLDRDVLAARPDVVFVEFAVNDSGMVTGWRRRSFEALIRALLLAPARPHVVVILTTFGDPDKAQALGHDHREIAQHYALPVIDVGEALWAAGAPPNLMSEFLPDGVHPNDAGYRVYAECIIRALADLPLDSERPRSPLPSPLSPALMVSAQFVTPDELDLPVPVVAIGDQRLPKAWELSPAGPRFEVPFVGSILGLAWWVSRDAGAMRWRVDGGDWQTLTCWDEYAPHFNRVNMVLLAQDLDPGQHRLEVEPLTIPVPGSEGTAMRIAAVLSAQTGD